MSDTYSLFNNISEDEMEHSIDNLSKNYTIIWLELGGHNLSYVGSNTYAYLRRIVDVTNNWFTHCVLCYNRILSLQDRKENIFVIITDPEKPLVQRNLFILWHRLLTELQVAKVYVVQAKFDFTFYRYWLSFKQHQKLYFFPNETLLLQKLKNSRGPNTTVICLDTGTSELVNITNYGFNELFSDAAECFNYMISIRRQPMILIINSQNSNVSQYRIVIARLFSTKYYVYMFSTLLDIYILASSKTKQIGVRETDLFTNFSAFQKHLEQDISIDSPFRCNDELIYSLDVEPLQMSLRSVETETFLYYTHIVAQMPQTPNAKTEMIAECRLRYKDNPTELKKINAFAYEYYQQIHDNPIWWYTEDSFLFRLLNEACRSENIDLIYIFRNFIADVLQQLQALHLKFVDELCGIKITVYRGQTIATNELNSLQQNVGKLYSTNTFLSASADRAVAVQFAGDGSLSPQFKRVLFEYTIDTTIETKIPYADVRGKSSKGHEQELLFSMGTIFQIDSGIKMDHEANKNVDRCVKLRMVSENDDTRLASNLKACRQRMENTPVLLMLGAMALLRSRVTLDYSKAEQYYRLYLDEIISADNEKNSIDLIRAYSHLANLCTAKNDYNAAIEYFEFIIDICSKMPCSSLNNVENLRIQQVKFAYNKIAYVYEFKTIEYENVIETYNKLLGFLKRQRYPCSICIGNTMDSIGDMYIRLAHWSEAIKFYQEAYALLSNAGRSNRYRLDYAEEQISRGQIRYPDILFLIVVLIWCYCYLLDIFVDDIILWTLMSLSLLRCINYYTTQYLTRKMSNLNLLKRFDIFIDKIQKKLTNSYLLERRQRYLCRLYAIIPSVACLPKKHCFFFANKTTLLKSAYFITVTTVLLAAYQPFIRLPVTRSVMILFLSTSFYELNIVHWSILVCLYYYQQRTILSLLSAYIVLLKSDFQLVARQKRQALKSDQHCLKHDRKPPEISAFIYMQLTVIRSTFCWN